MTAAVGPYSAGYGPFLDYVLGARCVTAKGDVVAFGGRTMKNVTGYEIVRFLAGTRGLFAIAAVLFLKTLPVPERRVVLTARFEKEGDPLSVSPALEAVGGVVKTCDLIAENGFEGEALLAIGLEGMSPMVAKGLSVVREILEKAGAISVSEKQPEDFSGFRRAVSHRVACSGLLTLQAPPPASVPLLRSIRARFPEMPVVAHPLVGRVHVIVDEWQSALLSKKTLAVGGKQPIAWNRLYREGVSGVLSPGELRIARALKRELDPEETLNPHLRLG